MSIFATDSICPKGWEMARYDGDGSFRVLFRDVYSPLVSIWSNPTNKIEPSVNNKNMDAASLIKPFSIIKSGNYSYSNGNRINRSESGTYWMQKLISNATSTPYYALFSTFYLYPYNHSTSGYGDSVRCVAKFIFSTDSICPKGWEMARNSGNKSYETLLQINYDIKETQEIINDSWSSMLRIPFSFTASDSYTYSSGLFNARTNFAFYRESYKTPSGYARHMRININTINYKYSTFLGNGASVRRVAKIVLNITFML